MSNGVHTDIVLPVKSAVMFWDSYFDKTPLFPVITRSGYVSFGWGSRLFYLNTPEWKDLNPVIGFEALFLKGAPAMHVTLIDFPLYQGKFIKPVYLSFEQLKRITEYIKSAFHTDESGHPVMIQAKGYGDTDLFFEANGKFTMINTCNNWTNNGLKYAGIRCSLWTPFDKPILYQVSKEIK
jgi:uncharacterized protein (TIGR02117 family)